MIFEVEGLVKRRGDFVLEVPHFALPPGTILGVMGRNGAGKSTLIQCALGLLLPEAGSISWLGELVADAGSTLRDRIGFVQETPHFYDHLTLATFASLVAPFYSKWDAAEFNRLVQAFELPARRRIGRLSRGMRMKYALALALSHQAEVLILDEPTTGLDPVFRRDLLDRLLGVIQDENKAVIFSTQLTSDLDRVADYVLCLDRGRVVLACSQEELRDHWGVVRGGPELASPAWKGCWCGFRSHPFGCEALTRDREAARRQLPEDVLVERASLEEILILLTDKGEPSDASLPGEGVAAAAGQEGL